MIVVRIKNLNNILCKILLLCSLLIISLVKEIKIEMLYRLCIPYSQCIYHIVAVSDNRKVVWNCIYTLIILLHKMISSVISSVASYIAAELNLNSILGTLNLKRIAISKPVIRNLKLIAVSYLLLEHSVLISDTASVSRIAEC
jgi:hypothetical protein